MLNNMMLNNTRTITAAALAATPVSRALPARVALLGASALALALLCAPGIGHAQVVQGAERGSYQGSYEGGRVAGPVGAAVGGAVGAGVGGAIGAVDGALGIPYYGHRCHGYYNRYGHWRCYR
jgi:hypothetical protein